MEQVILTDMCRSIMEIKQLIHKDIALTQTRKYVKVTLKITFLQVQQMLVHSVTKT